MDTSQFSSSQAIDIMVVIDTDYVKHYIQQNRLTPSTNMDKPVPVDHIAKYMIVPAANALLGQATGDLNLKARNGDRVSFRGSSIYQNSDDAVIIYGFKKYAGVEVFNGNPMVYDVVDRKQAAIPDHTKTNGLPAIPANVNFYSYDATIGSTGEGNYSLFFALYTLDPNNSDKQILYSYCVWDPTITVE
ncbi:DNA-directed RNA polymerase subunit beta [Chryseobacterium lactis]|uniref:DNA-directed RNA polymerase subunit beta n=1 Tax=Chryseobacterium lactis TaxID=1241981 RepID=A0A3G6RYJ3_CHRLC|nr:inclusion body family protein [Chryseobacterium lactis]AZA81652.1 DNA-directed RNA polymerase subunit beta [Chryseobacterium lactis]AZB06650.1 DNA-directed RNA polymerase subunit beta [Chryseobacterium lactis]PNW15501.1 DNA-directed RNA polymerase subunit beta [Chryseobacterium lactis]